MTIKGKVIGAILTKMAVIAIMERVSNDNKYDFYGCLIKEWSKCRSPVEAILKNMKSIKSYEEKNEQNTIFGHFPF